MLSNKKLSNKNNEFESTCETNVFLNDVLMGLSQPQKTLPCKYFYDEHGSLLFEKICGTSEYYVTRTEMRIYADYGADMAAANWQSGDDY